jgi:ankyrin repeat protein
MVALLIELGADVTKAHDGFTPLTAAVMRDHAPTVEVLIDKGADLQAPGPGGFPPLPLAIGENKYEVAKTLMEAGADVKAAAGEDDLTPLMIAAAQKAPAEGAIFLPSSTRPLDIAKGLLERGADVNAQSKEGMTALMIAAAHNNPPMIGLLIESGADINVTNNQGKTAAGVAELNDNMEAAQAVRVLGTAKAASARPPESPQGTTSQ